MNLYTSYFANQKNLPENVITVSICGEAPEWYEGLQYKKLAPKIGFFREWKKNHDNNYYAEHFNKEVLSTLNARTVVNDLIKLTGETDNDIVLLCYEKPPNFCHRHLVAQWLTDNGFITKEFEPKSKRHSLFTK